MYERIHVECKREYLMYTETHFLKWKINQFSVFFIFVTSVQELFFPITCNPLNSVFFSRPFQLLFFFWFLGFDYNIEPEEAALTQMY